MQNSTGLNDISKRVGIIRFNKEIIQDDHALLVQVFYSMHFVPIRAEYMLSRDYMEYCGFSPHFNILTDGEGVPVYEVGLQVDGPTNGLNYIKLKRVDSNVTNVVASTIPQKIIPVIPYDEEESPF